MRWVSVPAPVELESRQTRRMRELEEGWNGRDSPWRSSLPNLNRLRKGVKAWEEGPLRRALGRSDEIPMRIRTAGNEIVQRSHRTIKRIAARTRWSVMEAVYWYNVTPKEMPASTAQANIIYSYTARIRGVDVTLPPGGCRTQQVQGRGIMFGWKSLMGDVVWKGNNYRPHWSLLTGHLAT